jgi:hypothetical protein
VGPARSGFLLSSGKGKKGLTYTGSIGSFLIFFGGFFFSLSLYWEVSQDGRDSGVRVLLAKARRSKAEGGTVRSKRKRPISRRKGRRRRESGWWEWRGGRCSIWDAESQWGTRGRLLTHLGVLSPQKAFDYHLSLAPVLVTRLRLGAFPFLFLVLLFC